MRRPGDARCLRAQRLVAKPQTIAPTIMTIITAINTVMAIPIPIDSLLPQKADVKNAE
jgi:hypothetical protein